MNTPPRTRYLLIGLLLLAASATQLSAQNKNLKMVSNVDGGMPYLLHLPDVYDDHGESARAYPTIIFLHGYGERCENWTYGTTNELSKLENANGIPPYHTARGNNLDFNFNGQTEHFILIVPQTKKSRPWNSADVVALLDEVSSQYRVDSNRVYLTGFSFGATGTWDVLTRK